MKVPLFSLLMALILFSLTSLSHTMEEPEDPTPIVKLASYQVGYSVTPNGLIWQVDAPDQPISLKIYTTPLYQKVLMIQKIDFSDNNNENYYHFEAFNAFFFGLTTCTEKPKKVSIRLKSVNNMPNMLAKFLSARFGFKIAHVFFQSHPLYRPIPDCIVLMSAKMKDISKNLKS